jgi:hypothetical protein
MLSEADIMNHLANRMTASSSRERRQKGHKLQTMQPCDLAKREFIEGGSDI